MHYFWELLINNTTDRVLPKDEFDSLVKKYTKSLERTIRYGLMRHNLPEDLLGDMVTETFLSVYRTLSNSDLVKIDQPEYYLNRSGIHQIYKYIRENHKVDFVYIDDEDFLPLTDNLLSHDNIEHKIMNRQLFATLTEQQKNVFTLCRKGLNPEAIANFLQIEKSTVYVLIHQCKNILWRDN